MDMLQFLNIYEGPINDAFSTAEAAMTDAGVRIPDIDWMYDYVKDKFYNGELDYSDISNSMIAEAFAYAKDAIEKEIEGIDITYYVNCTDSHFYVNGEEYFDGEDTIKSLKECPISISFVEEVAYKDINAVRAVLNIEDEEILEDLINGAEDKNQNSLTDIYDFDGWSDSWELLGQIDKGERLKNFEASAYLLPNGKRVYEIKVTDAETDKEMVFKADRPEQLQNPHILRTKMDSAIRAFDKEEIDNDSLLELFEKYEKNHDKPAKEIER